MIDTEIHDDVVDLHNTSRSQFDLAEEVAASYPQLILVVILVSTQHLIWVG